MQAINPTRASSTVRRTHGDDIVRTYRMINCKMREIKNSRDNKLPYINGEADGLSFSSYGKLTPSLDIVFEEINRTHSQKRTQTHLDDWAEQGVLLLNAVLTTRMGKSREHHGWGWELFTREVLKAIHLHLDQPIVFMAWGRDAYNVITSVKHREYKVHPWKILKAHHPQAQNYNPANKFVGCNHFIDANLFLIDNSIPPIYWADQSQDMMIQREMYVTYVRELFKQFPHAKTYFLEKLCSYTSVSGKPHPFDNGLQSDYTEDLPF